MTAARKLRLGILALTAIGAVTVSLLLLTHRAKPPPLSLIFERYGTVKSMDPFLMDVSVQEVAFLWITNSSDKDYYMAMAGGTNSGMPDSAVGIKRFSSGGSYMPVCEFSDQTPSGSAQAVEQFSIASLGNCLQLKPHSTTRLRVALPSAGQKRKFAVICLELPQGPRPFWTSRLGRTAIRVLPRAVAMSAMYREPTVMRIWCDRELTHDGETRK